MSPEVATQSPNQQTTREFPVRNVLNWYILAGKHSDRDNNKKIILFKTFGVLK